MNEGRLATFHEKLDELRSYCVKLLSNQVYVLSINVVMSLYSTIRPLSLEGWA